jgi:amino acid transporter
MGGYGTWLFQTLTIVGLLVVRKLEPEKDRPFKTWLSCPIVIIISGICVAIIPFFGEKSRYSALTAICILLAGTLMWIWRTYVKLD